ncbi:Uma2 family endonuclease [Anthocerotibacter panamensis]|uniref:Uma2 family endonuclease n=1 Tax=Anthocerotibacter panamensis TaxID=2857077 RepID=UPI001C407AE0|nr:Uma2 family endonuclease [Anthocerotibacter panamensis]
MFQPLHLPTMYDLPSEEVGEAGLPDEYHGLQAFLLSRTFRPVGYAWEQVFTAVDLNLYYDLGHTHWYKRPDWFAAVGVSRLYEGHDLRQSYVIWQEQVAPILIVEILSPGTENEDLGRTERQPGKPPTKWEVYEQILQVPYYLVFDEETHLMQFFKLSAGYYQEVRLAASFQEQRMWIEELGIGLGLWYGFWESHTQWWLRWYDRAGDWILTSEEQAQQQAQQAQQQAQQAQQQAQQAEERAQQAVQEMELLRSRLRALGLDPDKL